MCPALSPLLHNATSKPRKQGQEVEKVAIEPTSFMLLG